ncbi:zinc finger protein ZAT4-like [Andrographis paniculata]|uniref:zinc finger protein ZAT4-like n=1 Tax=Andrographis paniculata TaxID=175694 RepID=UPI0021E90288|nr:zinc finger protein ZAT4-like [Andrographis paniculata]
MEEEQQDLNSKHTCKFCSKNFPCGRSLGGHMRSHLITISSKKKKKNSTKNSNIDSSKFVVNGGDEDQFGCYGLRANPRKTMKYDDALIEDNLCKECGKGFQSLKALFGHMKCHSVNNNGRIVVVDDDDDSWGISDQVAVVDRHSDNEGAAALLRRKKRSSGRIRKYTSNAANSSSLTSSNEAAEQEEVALSLIILSRDKGDLSGLNSVVESSDNTIQMWPETENVDCVIGCNESEVVGFDHLKNDRIFKNKSRKRKRDHISKFAQVSDKSSKFACSICKKGFPSYQALGGHKASHKKFKGSCAPVEHSLDQSSNNKLIIEHPAVASLGWNKNKDHECPICFKAFPSGQALGGHKRSHLTIDPIKVSNQSSIEPQQEIRHFLDLNLPAPIDEEISSECKPWWLVAGAGESLLGLLSTL